MARRGPHRARRQRQPAERHHRAKEIGGRDPGVRGDLPAEQRPDREAEAHRRGVEAERERACPRRGDIPEMRRADRVGEMDRDSDELLKSVAERAYEDRGYPLDIV